MGFCRFVQKDIDMKRCSASARNAADDDVYAQSGDIWAYLPEPPEVME